MAQSPEDAPIVAQLRLYNAASDEYEHETTMKRLTALIDETNFDRVMSIIPHVDPFVADDPEHAMGTRLIIMHQLILKEKRCIQEAHGHLVNLRQDYQELNGNWKAEVEEIDSLLATASGAE